MLRPEDRARSGLTRAYVPAAPGQGRTLPGPAPLLARSSCSASITAVNKLLEQVEQEIRSRKLFHRGQSILVAVSGGVDSMVLLRLLHELSKSNKWRLAVAHLNHQLRGRSSNADERLVQRTAEDMGLDAIIEPANVRNFARTNSLSLEMAARSMRHDFLARTAKRLDIPSIALAHHADDQVELFLLRLLRGSGGEGLSGMKWRSPSPSDHAIELIRPFLGFQKSDLIAFAKSARLQFREDASNAWLDIQRNRIRHELLPLLRAKYRPGLDKSLLRTIDIIGAETGFVDEAAKNWLSQTRRGPFSKLAVALQRKCIQLQLIQLGLNPTYDLVEHLRTQIDRPISVAGLESHKHEMARRDGSVSVWRDAAGVLEVRRHLPAFFKSDSCAIDLCSAVGESVFNGVRISWELTSQKQASQRPKPTLGKEIFDAESIGTRIVLRHWRPGDRFQPIGMPHSVKLQDLFINQKVPRESRHKLIVATTAEGELFWVEGMRIAERFKLAKTTVRRLHWRWHRGNRPVAAMG